MNMRIILVVLLFAFEVLAEDEELLADFDDIPLEVDRDFVDDFEAIEGLSSYHTFNVSAQLFRLYDARDVVRREKSLSLLGGNETIASAYYFTLFPQAKFEFWQVYGHLGLPLRFPVYDNVSESSGGFRKRGFFTGTSLVTPRPADFRSPWDIQKAVRHFEIGKPESSHFLRLSRSHALTLGHGELIRNLSPDVLYDTDLLFLSGHTDWQAFRLDGVLAPIAKAEFVGLFAGCLPFEQENAHAFVKNLKFGVSYGADYRAPNQTIAKDGSYVLSEDRRNILREHGTAQGAMASISSVYQPWSIFALMPYVTVGNLWLTGLKGITTNDSLTYGAGIHLGQSTSFLFIPDSLRSVLTLSAEARLFSSKYYPSYFGSTYFIDRLTFGEVKEGDKYRPQTLSQYVASGGDGWFRVGYLLELGYRYEEVFSILAGYENAHSLQTGASLSPLHKLHLLTSVQAVDRVRLFLGYKATSLANFKELFNFEKSRALLSVRGQIKILSFLYFDSWVKHSFGVPNMFTAEDQNNGETTWLTNQIETPSLNFGLGLELAMTF